MRSGVEKRAGRRTQEALEGERRGQMALGRKSGKIIWRVIRRLCR